MPIYLLKSSPHNEDYLDYYATNDDEIAMIARHYIRDIYGEITVKVTIDHNTNEVAATYDDYTQYFYLVKVEKIA